MENTQIYNEVAELLAERLEEYEGIEVYGADLAYTLLENEMGTGSVDCSTYLAKKWIGENFDDLSEIVDDIADNYGQGIVSSVFTDPEGFQCTVYSYLADMIMGNCNSVVERWNDSFELDEEIISEIQEELS